MIRWFLLASFLIAPCFPVASGTLTFPGRTTASRVQVINSDLDQLP